MVSVFYTFTPALPGGAIQVDDATSETDLKAKVIAEIQRRRDSLGADKLDAAEAFING